MNRTILTQTQARELQRLDGAIVRSKIELAQILAQKIAYHQTEIAKAKAELETFDVRIFASNIDLFTLIFQGGQYVLVEVYGAPTADHARDCISHVFPNCRYTILDGDQSNGSAGMGRCWYSSAAQERQLLHDHRETIAQEYHA